MAISLEKDHLLELLSFAGFKNIAIGSTSPNSRAVFESERPLSVAVLTFEEPGVLTAGPTGSEPTPLPQNSLVTFAGSAIQITNTEASGTYRYAWVRVSKFL